MENMRVNIHSIVTHPLYSHTSTQYSPNRCVFTQSLYTHLLSLFSPTHSIFGRGHPHIDHSTNGRLTYDVTITQLLTGNKCGLEFYI
jgi:hypothetical protein